MRHKFCMDSLLTVKKADERGLYFWLAPSHFFWMWWCKCVPFLLCLFVSGSYWKIHDLSPVITFFKKFLSLWIRSRRWRHTSFGLPCSIVRFWGTIFAHTFLMANSYVKIWQTLVWLKFNSLAIIALWIDGLMAQGLALSPHCYPFSKLKVFQSGVHL